MAGQTSTVPTGRNDDRHPIAAKWLHPNERPNPPDKRQHLKDMYGVFYGFGEKLFSTPPDPSFLYLGRRHSMDYAALEYGVHVIDMDPTL